LKWMLLLFIWGTACLAEDAGRPPCKAQNRGRFWPEQANSDREFARKAERCGELQMCVQGVWRHRWEPLTVHVGQLGKGPKQAIPGCGKATAEAKAAAASLPGGGS
jgi:hypothetical protein